MEVISDVSLLMGERNDAEWNGAMLVNTFNRRNIAMMLRISQCQQSTAGLKVKYYLLFSENCIFSQSADGILYYGAALFSRRFHKFQ